MRKPDYPAPVRAFARLIFRLMGWQAVGGVPDIPKLVAIGAPHTTNWDGIIMLLTTMSLGVRMNWLGKHTLFKPPFGWLMRLSGGVPVNRKTTKNAVEQVVDEFKQHERMALIIAPEGTRKLTPHWKTGFYYIALGAGVPIVLAHADYVNKRGILGDVLYPTGDIEADFEIIRAYYADKLGKYPEFKGPIVPSPKD